MARPIPLTFQVKQDGNVFRLMVASILGLTPVGPRLLRGAWMNPAYVKAEFSDGDEAYRAKMAWDRYYEQVLNIKPRGKKK